MQVLLKEKSLPMKTGKRKLIFILILSLFIYACGSGLSNGVMHDLKIANQAERNGVWSTAKTHYEKALVQAKAEGATEKMQAILNYQYGRALGVTCSFKEAEQHLLKALEQDERNNGDTFKDLTELARLHYDQKNYSKAISYFEKNIPILEKWDASSKAPIAYSEILFEYSRALHHTGNTSKAEDLKNKAMDIRNQHSQRYSITERTPYGKYCD